MNSGQVGSVARALGFAGLLPQVAAVGLMLLGRQGSGDGGGMLMAVGYFIALGYGAVILSFLGGLWWSFAMRRAEGQGTLVVLAVIPSLIGAGVLAYAMNWGTALLTGWIAVMLGSAILLTLPVDRHLVHTGEAPASWMALRVPLSLGLGGLTILAGALLG